MNMKLVTVAVGASLSAMPLWAQAGVSVGGIAQVEIAREETRNAAGATTSSVTTVEDNSRGRFWITADEDLGGGLKGLAHFEFRVDTTGSCALETGGAACGTGAAQNFREKWVGLQGGFGTLKFGSVRQAYKYAGGALWDVFYDTNLTALGTGGMSGGPFGHGDFFDNSVAYVSPAFGGVIFSLTYSFDDVTPTNAAGGSTADDGDYSAAVEWKGMGGDLHLIAARSEDQNNALGATNNRTLNKVGAKFNFLKDYSVIGQYETNENDANTVDEKIHFLGLHAKFGNILAVLHWGKTQNDITNNDTDYLAVGAWYNFSKTFMVLGGYRTTEVDNGNEDKIWTVGMRKAF
jgi:predicted porin